MATETKIDHGIEEETTVSFSGFPLSLTMALDRVADKADVSRSKMARKILLRDSLIRAALEQIEKENQK